MWAKLLRSRSYSRSKAANGAEFSFMALILSWLSTINKYIYLSCARRWRIELWFRDIKTSMGMEVLRCKSPKMLHKELEMFFIAYNLIRCLMAEATLVYDVPMERLSFKGTVDSVRQFSVAIAQAPSRKQQKQLIAQLLEIIAQDQVPDRPGRRDPRAVKRRPKPFPLLNRPRDKFKEIAHRNRYWKNNPRKINR